MEGVMEQDQTIRDSTNVQADGFSSDGHSSFSLGFGFDDSRIGAKLTEMIDDLNGIQSPEFTPSGSHCNDESNVEHLSSPGARKMDLQPNIITSADSATINDYLSIQVSAASPSRTSKRKRNTEGHSSKLVNKHNEESASPLPCNVSQTSSTSQFPQSSHSSSSSSSIDVAPFALSDDTNSDEVEEGQGTESNQTMDLEDLEWFSKFFKQKRIKLGFTQGDVGAEMGKLYGNDFSQTTISRFEALNLSFKNMCKLKPLLQKWLTETENALKNGLPVSHVAMSLPKAEDASADSNCSTTLRRRKRRTCIEDEHRVTLEALFDENPKPTAEQMVVIGEELSMDAEVIRVWFCNRRQREKKFSRPVVNGNSPAKRKKADKGIVLCTASNSQPDAGCNGLYATRANAAFACEVRGRFAVSGNHSQKRIIKVAQPNGFLTICLNDSSSSCDYGLSTDGSELETTFTTQRCRRNRARTHQTNVPPTTSAK